MGHYWHICRVKAPSKDDALGAVDNLINCKAERGEVDHGFIMAVTTADGVISIEDKSYIKITDRFSLDEIKKIKDRLPDRKLAVENIKKYVNDLTIDNANDKIWDLEGLVHYLKHSITDKERDNFNIFEDVAFPLDLLEYGISDLNAEGYTSWDETESKYTFFVWTNCHM
jgi:hypothetical protein